MLTIIAIILCTTFLHFKINAGFRNLVEVIKLLLDKKETPKENVPVQPVTVRYLADKANKSIMAFLLEPTVHGKADLLFTVTSTLELLAEIDKNALPKQLDINEVEEYGKQIVLVGNLVDRYKQVYR